MFFDETIAAIATPIGVGGISVIRISGKDAIMIADKVFKGHSVPSKALSHTLHYGQLINPDSSEFLDSVLLSVMHAPHSYTGLDTIEIGCHGGVLNSRSILMTIIAQGARLAEPGEFTKLAFLNGKLDLAKVEAVADLIHAKTEGARRAAASQFMGNLSNSIDGLRKDLIQLCSLLELDLDFAEDNLLNIDKAKILEQIGRVEQSVQSLLATYETGHLIRDGAKVSIVGKPNVGKSSLLNGLLKKDRAIVSDVPGTTRDYIEETIEIGGVPFSFIDTAGIRNAASDIEKKGISFSKELLKNSDLVLLVLDGSRPLDNDDDAVITLIKEINVKTITIINKSDLEKRIEYNDDHIAMSAKNDSDLIELKNRIKRLFQLDISFESPMISRERHKHSLSKSLHSLDLAKVSISKNVSYEFATIDIKNAINSLGDIVGKITNDDILNNIFSSFCIGK